MSKISEALEQVQQWNKGEALTHMASYVLEREDAALAFIKPEGRWNFGDHSLTDALRPPLEWQEEDARLVRALVQWGSLEALSQWLDMHLKAEKAGQSFHEAFCRELEGFSRQDVATFTLQRLSNLLVDGRATSAGQFVLGLSDPDLSRVVKQGELAQAGGKLLELLLKSARGRVPLVVDLGSGNDWLEAKE